jgi:hypothetical protein
VTSTTVQKEDLLVGRKQLKILFYLPSFLSFLMILFFFVVMNNRKQFDDKKAPIFSSLRKPEITLSDVLLKLETTKTVTVV